MFIRGMENYTTMVPEWLRKLGKFLPNYGECGGYSVSCAPKRPKDEMDELFQQHDMNLFASDQLPPEERKIARKESDRILYEGLKSLDVKKISLYGKLYRQVAMVVFK